MYHLLQSSWNLWFVFVCFVWFSLCSGGDVSLRNVGIYLQIRTASQPKRSAPPSTEQPKRSDMCTGWGSVQVFNENGGTSRGYMEQWSAWPPYHQEVLKKTASPWTGKETLGTECRYKFVIGVLCVLTLSERQISGTEFVVLRQVCQAVLVFMCERCQ
jgi:hypothetical protein